MQTPMMKLYASIKEIIKIHGSNITFELVKLSLVVEGYLVEEKQMVIDAYNNVKPDYLDGNKIDGAEFFKEVYDGKI